VIRSTSIFFLWITAVVTCSGHARAQWKLSDRSLETESTERFRYNELDSASEENFSCPDDASACDRFPEYEDTLHDHRSSWTGFIGIDGSKQPQDLGVNAHLGNRVAVQYGRQLFDRYGLGLQIGTSVTASANAVQVLERIEGTEDRIQSFSTIGLFQRFQNGWSGAIGYDLLYQDYFDQSFLGQVRLQLNRRVSMQNEFGIAAAIATQEEHAQFSNSIITLKPLSYGRFTWRRYWENQAFTSAWVGLAESHSETNVALGDLPSAGRQFLFGADLRAPLNRVCALYGEANFLMPANTGAVDAFLGIEFSTNRCGKKCNSRSSLPLLPLAGNPSFMVNGHR
jgi:hypothetical protein